MLSLASLVVRFRSATELERQQLLCLAVGGFALLLGLVLDVLGVAGGWVLTALAIPVAAGVAILRHHLYDLDLFLNRSLVYAGLSVTLLAAYAAIVWLGNELAHTTLPTGTLPLFAAAVVAIALEPLRRRLQHSVDHVLDGDRGDPYAVVTALGRRAGASGNPLAVLSDVAETVAKSLALPYAGIELATDDGGMERAAEWGRPLGEPTTLPLTYRGEHVGNLLVRPRTVGRRFSATDRRLLRRSRLPGRADRACRAAFVRACSARARPWSPHARRSVAACAATCTTASARTLAAHDPASSSAARPAAPRPGGAATACSTCSCATLQATRSPTSAGWSTSCAAGARRARAGRRLRRRAPGSAGRSAASTSSVDAPEALPPLPAAVEVAALPHRAGGARRTSRATPTRARCVGPAGAPTARWTSRSTTTATACPTQLRAGVGLRSMRERAAELGGTCRRVRRPGGGRASAPMLPATLGRSA